MQYSRNLPSKISIDCEDVKFFGFKDSSINDLNKDYVIYFKDVLRDH